MKENALRKGKRLEEVKQFKYLGYTMKCNGRQQAYIKERVRRGATMLEQGDRKKEVCGI